MLSKSQQVFSSAYRGIQRLTWNFFYWELNQENAIANEAAHLLTESCKVEKIDFKLNSQKRGLILDKVAIFFFTLSCQFQTLVCK